MGLLRRGWNVFVAICTFGIVKLEDPELMLPVIIQNMKDQLNAAKVQVAATIADQKRLDAQCHKALEDMALWDRRAAAAIKAGDDNLAREALNRKQQCKSLADGFKTELDKQTASVTQLKAQLQALNADIESKERKKNLLIAQSKRAKAQKNMAEISSGLSNSEGADAFARMEEKIAQQTATAEATYELAAEYNGTALEDKFRTLETNSGVEDDLVAMKRAMGLMPPAEAPKPMRVEVTPDPASESALSAAEAAELEAAKADIEAEKKQMATVQ